VTLTVAVDAAGLSDASELRGIGTYLRQILAGLAAQPDVRVLALAAPGAALPPGVERLAVRRLVPARLPAVPTGRAGPSRIATLALRYASTRLAPAEHDLALPRDLRRAAAAGAAVALAPGLPPPRRSPVPWVQTLHDVIPLARPDPLAARETARWRRLGPRIRDAAAVIAVSRHSADEGIALLGLDPARVHVVHNGVDPAFRPDGPAAPSEPPYVLYVGSWGAHKGIGEAIAVVDRLAAAGYPHRLVIAGPQDVRQRQRIAACVSAADHPERVEVAGWVPDLPALYRGAAALVVTSRHEGFCLPAVEAMASGTPVVAFANSALPEVVGDGGLLVPDGDVDAMVAALRPVLDDPATRRDLVAAGLRRAARFNWGASAAAHAEILRSVAG
jgi:alpha-1,3-rhamnosyl/mannosyltransferase